MAAEEARRSAEADRFTQLSHDGAKAQLETSFDLHDDTAVSRVGRRSGAHNIRRLLAA
jgi:hypothetical protein